MKKIFELNTISELEKYLLTHNKIDEMRVDLFDYFIKYAEYKNVDEWNKAVRICESLAIIGWGEYEPLEALRGQFFNGNPMTSFVNKSGVFRFVDAIWSKRQNGWTMELGRASFHASPDDKKNTHTILNDYPIKEEIQALKLNSQRNWIPKNPIWITRRISNCYENSRKLIESLHKEFQMELNEKMRPENYGRKVNKIILNCAFSYFDHEYCKTNYIISKSKKKLTSKKALEEIHTLFSKKEIEENGYYLRNRYDFGPFRKDTGKTNITIYLEREFSELSYVEQKMKLSYYFTDALSQAVDKLKKKKLDYNFELMMVDFIQILSEWTSKVAKQ